MSELKPCPFCEDGDVKLHQMLEFAKEYDWLLEHIIKIAKEL